MLTVLTGDAIEQLRTLPNESVQCCVTSPPFWGLRDYGTARWEGGSDDCKHEGDKRYYTEQTAAVSSAGAFSEAGQANVERLKEGRWRNNGTCVKCGAVKIDAQLGLEKTPEEYVAKMVEVFREVRRVLRKDGTLWLNLGDSYAASRDSKSTPDTLRGDSNGTATTFSGNRNPEALRAAGLKHKDLCGIPWRVAFALQADGWWLRSDIIWAKPNPMPESVTDRPTKAHEYLFLLTKASTYYYDAEAIKEQSETPMDSKARCGFGSINGKCNTTEFSHSNETGKAWEKSPNRNKRSVWTVATAPYPEAHFATYPPDLIKPCIMAGTSAKGCCAKCGAPWVRLWEFGEVQSTGGSVNNRRNGHTDFKGSDMNCGTFTQRDHKTIGWQPACKCNSDSPHQIRSYPEPCTVLDPFAGSGTTGMVAIELGRKAVLIELNPKYVELIQQRCNVTMGLALS